MCIRDRPTVAAHGESDRSIRKEPVHVKKVGRNDPCPCGSGKKYKKCCGANEEVTEPVSYTHLDVYKRQISRIRLREQYNNDNSLFLLLEKIQDELRGSMHRTLIYDENGQLPDTSSLFYSKEGKVSVTGEYFTGLSLIHI